MAGRADLERLLGVRLGAARFDSVQVVGQAPFGDWVLEDLRIDMHGEGIPATFLRPETGPVPALIYCHAHGNRYEMGREELTEGRPALTGPYAPDLCRLGIAALSIEMPAFGTRQQPCESARAKAHLWRGTTLFGQMLAELSAGLSFLSDHPVIDADRLGALGLSMGSTHAFWLAALDDRVRAAAALCSFADLDRLVATAAHDGHGIYMTVPGLLPGWSTGQIAGLAAPRALQICVGMQDWSTPAHAFAPARAALEAAYTATPDQLEFHVEEDLGHAESPAMRQAVLSFLTRRLGDVRD
ncbi:alpha/beta hydrolase family protein [Nioella nitratireducens]|uniref:alpha/beta hydrolase family protein n=1 Tax=Nioella nitratireducens TaxID=1287720 RepID=UPI0008FD2F36|nr:hypothetical protein [Nioella nitratireducens]